jgi:integrase
MRLTTAVDQIATECDLANVTVDQYKRAVERYSLFIGHDASEKDLTTENVNKFLVVLQQTLTGKTARNYRVSLTRVWNYLAELGKIDSYDVRRLRRPKQINHPVIAWSCGQFSTLIAACELVDGRFRCGMHARNFIAAWLWVQYATVFRPGDMRMLRWSQVDWTNKVISLAQSKTGNPHTACIGPESLQALKTIKTVSPLVFPLTKGGVRRWELALYEKASTLGFDRSHGQGLGTIRKTHATEVYKSDGEVAAAESLGHVGGARTVRASYIDHRAIGRGRLPRRPA